MGKKFPKVEWPETGAVGDKIKAHAERVFVVEACWAYPHEPERGPWRWSTYYAHAFRDRKSGKLIMHQYPEIWKDHPDKVEYNDPRGSTHHECFAFYTLPAAVVCMELLKKKAEWASDYDSKSEWNLRQRGRPIKFRVVEKQKVETVTVAAI